MEMHRAVLFEPGLYQQVEPLSCMEMPRPCPLRAGQSIRACRKTQLERGLPARKVLWLDKPGGQDARAPTKKHCIFGVFRQADLREQLGRMRIPEARLRIFGYTHPNGECTAPT